MEKWKLKSYAKNFSDELDKIGTFRDVIGKRRRYIPKQGFEMRRKSIPYFSFHLNF